MSVYLLVIKGAFKEEHRFPRMNPNVMIVLYDTSDFRFLETSVCFLI